MPNNQNEFKGRPEAENLINIFAALSDDTAEKVMLQFAGQQFSTFKNTLAELAVSKLAPITTEMRRLMADRGEIDRILKTGAEKAKSLAQPILDEVKKIVGFVG